MKETVRFPSAGGFRPKRIACLFEPSVHAVAALRFAAAWCLSAEAKLVVLMPERLSGDAEAAVEAAGKHVGGEVQAEYRFCRKSVAALRRAIGEARCDAAAIGAPADARGRDFVEMFALANSVPVAAVRETGRVLRAKFYRRRRFKNNPRWVIMRADRRSAEKLREQTAGLLGHACESAEVVEREKARASSECGQKVLGRARREDADLIVVPRRKVRGPAEEKLDGGVRRVLAHARRPVLVT